MERMGKLAATLCMVIVCMSVAFIIDGWLDSSLVEWSRKTRLKA